MEGSVRTKVVNKTSEKHLSDGENIPGTECNCTLLPVHCSVAPGGATIDRLLFLKKENVCCRPTFYDMIKRLSFSTISGVCQSIGMAFACLKWYSDIFGDF